MQIAVIMGSMSDRDKMAPAAAIIKEFGVKVRSFVISAHRVPEKLDDVIGELEEEGTGCIIAGAGLAAHLPGVIASKTLIPVVGIPLSAKLGAWMHCSQLFRCLRECLLLQLELIIRLTEHCLLCSFWQPET